jgi:hypothetical protein
MRINITCLKNGVEYIVRSHHKKMNLSLVSVGQMKRLVNASKNFVLLMIKAKDVINLKLSQDVILKLKYELSMKLLIIMMRCFRNQRDYLQKEESNMRFSCSKMLHFLTLVCTKCQFWRIHEIKKQIQEFLDKGVIVPSTSPCGSPIVLVPNKDGTWCMCVDF